MLTRTVLLLTLGLLAGCIGTDFTDEPLGLPPSHAEINESSLSLVPNDLYALNFRLVAVDGSTVEDATWQWLSRNESVATVTSDGIVAAIDPGQAWVVGTANGEFSDSVLVTVTTDPNAIASIEITGEMTNLPVGASRQLTATARNLDGDIISATFTWESSDPSIASVDSEGLVTAQAEGNVSITAVADGIASVPFAILCGESVSSREGTFSGRNGYNAKGLATLETVNDSSTLRFSEDFQTSAGPGLYIYLSPQDNGVSGAVSLGEIQSNNGEQAYGIPPTVNPDEYDHVIIYCKPFGVLFGVATLE